MLTMPQPLDSRLFHTREAVTAYNQQVADFLRQQAEADYNSKTSKRNKQRRQRYSDDN